MKNKSIQEIKKIIDLDFCNYSNNEILVIIAGPTGVGKSEFAFNLAQNINGSIINADAIQVYRELKIMSARPDTKLENMLDHYLYGFQRINHYFSVGNWLNLVHKVLAKIDKNNKIGILVGGSGLYINAAKYGITPVPTIEKNVKEDSKQLFEKIGINEFRNLICNIDSNFSSKSYDKQRLLRAHSVFISTGKTLTEWHKLPNEGMVKRKIISILLTSDRKKIYKTCNLRFDNMISLGGLDEVKEIWKKNFDRSLSGLKSLGVRRLLDHFDRKISLNDAIELSKKDTRNYVKRQITWFKHNYVTNIVNEI